MTEQAVVAAEAAAHGKPVGYAEAGLPEDFAKLVRRRAEIQAAAEKVNGLLDANAEEVKKALEASGIKSVTVSCLVPNCQTCALGKPHWQSTICDGRKGRKKIDGFKLMQINPTVTADQIVRATKQGETGKPYLLVTDLTKPRGKAEE